MRTELPVCKRFCFCLPLRYGSITWGYIRLKSLKLLRVYYVYSIILFILTALMAIDSAIYILNLFKIGEIDFKFHIRIIVVDIAILLAQSLVQICALLLVRSEIIKLRSHCEFRFVNNAGDVECTLKCKEINGEEG